MACDDQGKPLILLLTEGQKSDVKGAEHMLEHLPRNAVLIADRAYDSKAFRDALAEREITACIPSSRTRKIPIPHDERLYRKRNAVERFFARLKDFRRIAMRYDRCPNSFFAAVIIAAITIAFL